MSGGRFSYRDSSLMWEMFPNDRCVNVMEDREISEIVWDVLNLIHDYDWYASGDTCEETYLKAKNAFKKKWFGGNRGLRIRRIVDDALEETRRELYKTFSLEGGPNDTDTH